MNSLLNDIRLALRGLIRAPGSALLFVVALVASAIPARRAMNVNPIVALRYK